MLTTSRPNRLRLGLVTLVILATLSRATPAAVTFAFQRTPNGRQMRQVVHVRTTANSTFEQSNQIISDERLDTVRDQVRELTVLESDPAKTAAVEVTYAKATTRDAKRRFHRPQPQPVHKQTYRVTRAEGVLHVTYPDGSDPPPEETAIVQSDMQAVGRSNPLAQFLSGRTVEIGQQLELPEALAADWFSQSAAFKNAKRVLLRLQRVKKIGGQRCGLFELQMLGPQENASEPIKLCQGEVAVVVATCRTVRTVCDARFTVREERGPAGASFTVKNRGTAHIEIQSQDRSSGLPAVWASTWERYIR